MVEEIECARRRKLIAGGVGGWNVCQVDLPGKNQRPILAV
jgi:hypothetical protein